MAKTTWRYLCTPELHQRSTDVVSRLQKSFQSQKKSDKTGPYDSSDNSRHVEQNFEETRHERYHGFAIFLR
jgi:hypothetical protein